MVNRIVQRLRCVALLILSCSVAIQPAAAATPLLISARSVSSDCEDRDIPIYLLSGRYIQGRGRLCGTGLTDITTGPQKAAAGEMLFVSACRLAAGAPKAFMRGRPNTAYTVRADAPGELAVLTSESRSRVQWSTVARVLPFVPTRIYDLGVQDGHRWYTYGALQFVPSRINSAYPLNQNSVIVSIDGCSFNSPDTITTMMDPPGASKYLEIVYYQVSETPVVFRRAFIPSFQRAEIATEWRQLTTRYPIFDQTAGRFAGIVVFTGLAFLIYQFSESSLGQKMKRDYDACMARNSPMAAC